MFRKSLVIAAVLGAAALAPCGGGAAGGSSAASYGGLPPPSPPQNANLPLKQNVAGAPAFVSASNHRTLYFLDVDTPTGGKCTGGCLTTWLVNAKNAAANSAGSLTIVPRSDGPGCSGTTRVTRSTRTRATPARIKPTAKAFLLPAGTGTWRARPKRGRVGPSAERSNAQRTVSSSIRGRGISK